MKKTLVLFVSILTLILTSCSNDYDDSLRLNSYSIEGKWEYYEEGTISGGVETLTLWNHECSTTKDYVEFLNGGVLKDVLYLSDCTEDINHTGTWVKNGNNLTVTLSITTTGEIMILNETTLKVKYVEGGVTSIQVLKRV